MNTDEKQHQSSTHGLHLGFGCRMFLINKWKAEANPQTQMAGWKACSGGMQDGGSRCTHPCHRVLQGPEQSEHTCFFFFFFLERFTLIFRLIITYNQHSCSCKFFHPFSNQDMSYFLNFVCTEFILGHMKCHMEIFTFFILIYFCMFTPTNKILWGNFSCTFGGRFYWKFLQQPHLYARFRSGGLCLGKPLKLAVYFPPQFKTFLVFSWLCNSWLSVRQPARVCAGSACWWSHTSSLYVFMGGLSDV